MSIKRYVLDTETTIEAEPRVWSWEALEVGDVDHPIRGISINGLIEWLAQAQKVVYIHNLKFDASYILSYLFQIGFEHTEERTLNEGEFSTLISDTGVYYVIDIRFENGVKCRLLDSYKIIPMKVEDMAKAYGLEFRKLEIDYAKPRPVGYQPTEHEWAYQHADVAILSLSLTHIFNAGLKRITQSSNAMTDYINMTGGKLFRKRFPELSLELDRYCRNAYFGGSTQVGERFKGRLLGNGLVFDINSSYPWAMRYCLLPYGEPVYYEGEYVPDDRYPLYIARFSCWFKLKKDHIPCVMGKHMSRFKYDKFLTDSRGEIVEMTLTSIDIALLFDQYDVKCVTWIDGYKFKGSKQLFKDYIDKWYREKEQATISGNKPMRSIAKDMMNKLSGKFGVKPKLWKKVPYYDGRIRYRLSDEADEPSHKGYVPVIAFITAYGRDKIIRGAQANFERFVYMDTDSLHLLGWEDPVGIEIDDVKLGAFKCENRFVQIKALHAKCYIEEILCDEKEKESLIRKEVKKEGDFKRYEDGYTYTKVTVAGLPANCHEQVTFDNFKVGAIYTGKLRPDMTSNGILLKETTFEIKDVD